MATESTTTDFLRFSAYSMKELITRKLTSDSHFTDQVYEGSNLAVLIDIFSYMFQCLAFQLNSAASESMFSDTQLYQNMVRLCKFVGYHPKGRQQPTMDFTVTNMDFGDIEQEPAQVTVQAYSYVETGRYSGDEQICYSFVNGYSFESKKFKDQEIYTQRASTANLVCGKWTQYSQKFTAQGLEHEVFLLNLDKDDVAWPYVDAYVIKDDKWEKCERVVGPTFIRAEDGKITTRRRVDGIKAYELVIDENGKYRLEFGVGKPLSPGDTVTVFYVKACGEPDGGAIKLGEVSAKIQNMTEPDLPSEPFGNSFDEQKENYSLLKLEITVTNSSVASMYVDAEDAEQMRENAPKFNKVGSRLVTRDDYETFVKYMNASTVIDVKAQNNYEYANTFYRWLYQLGKEKHQDPSYYINEEKFQYYGYRYSDAADQNTVYLWVKMLGGSDIYFNTIDSQIEDLKMVTADVCYLQPISLNFAVCGSDDATALADIRANGSPGDGSYVEVAVNGNSIYQPAQLADVIRQKIADFFDETRMRIGGEMAIGDLVDSIYQLGGIKSVNTAYSRDGVKYMRHGLNFACWSAQVLDVGDDLQFMNGNRPLEVFQFPTLMSSDIVVKVIKKTNQNVQTEADY